MTTTTTTTATIAGHDHALRPGSSDWTLLLLHGTGGDEHDLLPLGAQLAPDATLLSPRGRVREGGVTNRFFARRAANDIDLDDLALRTEELATFLREATTTYDLDPTRIVALGYSNGANIALNLLLTHPGLLHAAALLRPVLYLEPEQLPDLAGMPVLAAAGAHDPYTPPDVLEHLRTVLDRAGAQLQLVVEPHAGHPLAQGDLVATDAWLRSVLDA